MERKRCVFLMDDKNRSEVFFEEIKENGFSKKEYKRMIATNFWYLSKRFDDRTATNRELLDFSRNIYDLCRELFYLGCED